MKCFERLVMAHINTIIPERNAYVRMLFIDYNSAFNTIVPSKLVNKLRTL
jgi:hypothetical protein